MVKFILNEAKDKAQEIEARALEDFNIEKLKLVQQMKDKIRQEFDKKAKKLEVQRSMYVPSAYRVIVTIPFIAWAPSLIYLSEDVSVVL